MTTVAETKGRSPYAKYNKAPYQYSDAYQNWRNSVRAGKDRDAMHWAAEHAKRFGPRS